MAIMETLDIRIERYTEVNTKGVFSKVLTSMLMIKGAFMPVGPGETSVSVAENTVFEITGNRNPKFMVLYTKTPILKNDIVVDPENSDKYEVWNLFDYSKYGEKAWHYKVICIKVED